MRHSQVSIPQDTNRENNGMSLHSPTFSTLLHTIPTSRQVH